LLRAALLVDETWKVQRDPWRDPLEPPPVWHGWRWVQRIGAAALAALALTVGLLRAINTWDYPTYLAIAAIAVALSARPIGPLPRGVGWTADVGWRLALVIGVGFVAALPFVQHYQLAFANVTRAPGTTPLWQYLAVFGLFLALIGGALALDLRTAPRHGPWRLALVVAAPVLVGLGLLGLSVVALALVALTAIALVVGGRLLRSDGGSAPDVFGWVVVAAGVGVSAVVDVVTLQGDPQRTDTVFKLYFQAWTLLGVSAGAAVWRLWTAWPTIRPALRRTVGVAMALLALSAFAYPVAATPARLAERFAPLAPTLDGRAYQRAAVIATGRGPMSLAADAAAIDWLRAAVDGAPTILEGRGPIASWSGRYAVGTGLPSVLGWESHQRLHRASAPQDVAARAAAVDAAYASPDIASLAAVTRAHRVQYVIVGPWERAIY
ncbi:MAG: DUF2298 domain-containing protein, partial [Dehalococcoidia bacterium]|nr:DUF2298 domain-containing protein [Dehalococcoidia bacterium]